MDLWARAAANASTAAERGGGSLPYLQPVLAFHSPGRLPLPGFLPAAAAAAATAAAGGAGRVARGMPCAGHADCGGSSSYCRQAVGGPQCSPCTDYRALTCEDWRDDDIRP